MTIDKEIVKETEISPLVWLEFLGLPEEKRKGFFFTNVINVKRRKYNVRITTAVDVPSIQVYALGLVYGVCRSTAQIYQVKSQSLLWLFKFTSLAVNLHLHLSYQRAMVVLQGRGCQRVADVQTEIPGRTFTDSSTGGLSKVLFLHQECLRLVRDNQEDCQYG